MVGMRSLVTRSVPDFHLVAGHPAQAIGLVCRCGEPFQRFAAGSPAQAGEHACQACGLRYAVERDAVRELSPPP
jgi:hypothetical protein